MMRPMGTIASQETQQSATSSDEGGVRAAILGAARRVAEREGVLEMTLTAVASEASVSATDIYAFFTSKNDMLQAVVADDLATLAKAMRQSLERQPEGVNTTAIVQNSQPQDAPVPPMQATESRLSENRSAPETVAPAPLQETPRRFPVVQARRTSASPADASAATAEAIARLQETVAKLESTPVDQWLERRLREFERTLYALQHNQNQGASTTNSFDQGLQSVRESIEALDMRHAMAADESSRAIGDRFDSFDKRLRETLSELQAESVHLARRITALENLAFASRPELMPPPIEFVAVEQSEPVMESAQATAEAAPDATRNGNDTTPSYLAAARRSAQVAAEQVNQDLRQKAVAPRPNKTLLYAACGSLALFALLLAGAGFMLRNSSMDTPTVLVAARMVPVHTARIAAAKPLRHVALQKVAQKAPQANLLQLAQTGDAAAQLLVGLQYLEGKGEPKNEAMAVDWLSRAAAKGQPVAQYDLGALYADGRGVPADAVQAFQWFGSAALHGNRRAMHFLAIAYAEGAGTAKDLPEAARWFERSATLGAVNSQFNLAVLYERGMGVPQSLTTAYKWYAIAAAQGDREAQARVTAMASTLKPDDLASAKSAADSFKPEPLDPAANLPPKYPS
jgi:TPR repeat protein